MSVCPLCNSKETKIFHDDNIVNSKRFNMGRLYYQCLACELIFLNESMLPNQEIEIKKYNEHTNNPEEEGYRKFLQNLLDPLTEKLRVGDEGLDFGSGPGPTISVIMKERGFNVCDFDPYFNNDLSLLDKSYDFVTSTEVFEHFFKPKESLELVLSLLKDGGILGVMTKLYQNSINFNDWYYRRDATHVIFFTENTFKWIASHYHLKLEILSDNVIILQKQN